jgi:hypothetical protein
MGIFEIHKLCVYLDLSIAASSTSRACVIQNAWNPLALHYILLAILKLKFINECTEKNTREEQRGVYVGARAAPTYTGPPRAVDLFSLES